MIFAGLSAAGSVLGAVEGDAVSKQQHAVSTEMARRQREAAKDSALVQFGQLGRRETEEATAAFAEIDAVMRDADEAIGTVTASAGSSGLGGQSVDDLTNDYRRQYEEYATNVLRSEKARREALRDTARGISADLRAQYINTTVAPRRRTNWLTAGVGAVTAGVGAYTAAGGTFASPDDGLNSASASALPEHFTLPAHLQPSY